MAAPRSRAERPISDNYITVGSENRGRGGRGERRKVSKPSDGEMSRLVF